MGNNSSSGGLFSDGSLQDIFQRGPAMSALPPTPVMGDGLGNVNEAASGDSTLSGVFRSAASFGGDDHSLRAPGRELTLSSTASSGGAFFAEAERKGEPGRVMGTKSWGGPTCHDIHPAGQTHVGRDESLTTSMLGRDLDALLSFSDQPGHGSEDEVHKRVPSLVSKIDPELRISGDSDENVHAPALISSVVSPDDPILPLSDQTGRNVCGGAVGKF